MPRTLVLLSAYNGAEFIEQQIESIRSQSTSDWELLVRDDGSTDSTVQLVERLSSIDTRISLLNDRRNVGPWRSFALLLEEARSRNAEYVFLCDQDDVWLADKMAMELARLSAIEAKHGASQPALVHTDLTVVEHDLHTIASSWHEHQRMSYNRADPLRTLLIHNAVAGCTIALNRALLDHALPVPKGVYHDWWLALCAAAFGSIEMIDQPTVLYRQHSTNVVGAANRHGFVGRLVRNPLSFIRGAFDEFGLGVHQANALLDRARLKKKNVDRISSYCDAFMPASSLGARVSAFRASRAKPQRFVSRVLMYGIIAAYPAMRAASASSGEESGRA